MRASRIQLSSRLIYGGFLPDLLRNRLVRRRIAGPAPSKKTVKAAVGVDTSSGSDLNVEDNPEAAPGSIEPILPKSTASAADTVIWQLKENPGFLPSFISSIRYAPISNQHDRWRLIASRLNAQREAGKDTMIGLREGRILLMIGKTDGVVVPSEIIADAQEVLGERNLEVELLEGGHDMIITNARGCVERLKRFWDEGRR